MILTIDVGNTNTCFGCFEGDELKFESRISTQTSRMSDQYAIIFNDILKLYGIDGGDIDGAILSSVVPPVTSQIKTAVEKVCKCRVLVVSPGIKTGLNIKIDEPASLGSDLVAGAVGAKAFYPLPAIIVDMGTATKVYAVDRNGGMIGGIIAPGMKISLDALASKTAALPLISVHNDPPLKTVIGTNTLDCMRSGAIIGAACMVEGFIERFEQEIGEKCSVVATGGFSSVIKGFTKREFDIRPHLLLEGLLVIYKKNM